MQNNGGAAKGKGGGGGQGGEAVPWGRTKGDRSKVTAAVLAGPTQVCGLRERRTWTRQLGVRQGAHSKRSCVFSRWSDRAREELAAAHERARSAAARDSHQGTGSTARG